MTWHFPVLVGCLLVTHAFAGRFQGTGRHHANLGHLFDPVPSPEDQPDDLPVPSIIACPTCTMPARRYLDTRPGPLWLFLWNREELARK